MAERAGLGADSEGGDEGYFGAGGDEYAPVLSAPPRRAPSRSSCGAERPAREAIPSFRAAAPAFRRKSFLPRSANVAAAAATTECRSWPVCPCQAARAIFSPPRRLK